MLYQLKELIENLTKWTSNSLAFTWEEKNKDVFNFQIFKHRDGDFKCFDFTFSKIDGEYPDPPNARFKLIVELSEDDETFTLYSEEFNSAAHPLYNDFVILYDTIKTSISKDPSKDLENLQYINSVFGG